MHQLSPRQKTLIVEILKFLIAFAIGGGVCGCAFYGRYTEGQKTFEVGGTVEKPASRPGN